MKIFKNTQELDQTFYVSLVLKGTFSALEIIGGLLLLLIPPQTVNHLAVSLTQGELSQDPRDFVANHILKVGHDFANSGSRYFAAFYLISHGLVKLFVIVALFKEKLWAYPAMVAVLGCFVVYQVYRLSLHFTIGLTLLTLFDLFIIWLTLKEYKRHKHRLSSKPAAKNDS